jgi:hypothetical protein
MQAWALKLYRDGRIAAGAPSDRAVACARSGKVKKDFWVDMRGLRDTARGGAVRLARPRTDLKKAVVGLR